MPIRTIKVVVEGGSAKPGPPLAPTLSQLGLNVNEVIKKINDVTSNYKGMSVPVFIEVDTASKKYDVKVGVPTTTSLLLKQVGANEPSGDPAHKKVGNISLEDAIKVAILKKPSLTAKTLKAALKSVLGSARSIGLTVDGKDPKEVVKEVEEGKYKDLLAKYEEEWNKS